jgi:hypothetical protein
MKKLKMAAVAMGIMLLAGCGNKQNEELNRKTSKDAMEQGQPASSADKGGVVSSIKDAMGLGKTMRCTYRDKGENGGMEMISYVNGKSYMSETTVAGNLQKTVFNEDGMYSWSPSTKQGTKMTKACMEELEKSAPKEKENGSGAPQALDPTREDAFENAVDVKCEEVEADFTVPKDVNFVDQCEMMKKMMGNMSERRIPGSASGAEGNMPTIPNMGAME